MPLKVRFGIVNEMLDDGMEGSGNGKEEEYAADEPRARPQIRLFALEHQHTHGQGYQQQDDVKGKYQWFYP